MPDPDFELYLSLLVKLLKLQSEQTAAIRDELRDHLEQRLEELATKGIERRAAIRLALDEFGDAASLAEDFSRLARERRRKRIARWSAWGVVAAAGSLLLAFALWPVSSTGPGLTVVEADGPGTAAARDAAETQSVFVDVQPTCIDPVAFQPAALAQRIGEKPIVVPLQDLSEAMRELLEVTTVLDEPRLRDAAIAMDEPITLAGNLPLYLALDRAMAGHDIDWYWDRGVLHITSREHADQRLYTVQYSVREQLEKSSESALLEVILRSTGDESSSPWLETCGTGGTAVLISDLLSVRQTSRGHREVQALLAGLAAPAPELFLGEPEQNMALRRALVEVEAPVEFNEIGLGEAIDALRSQTGLPLALDDQRISEVGISPDVTVRLRLPSRPVGQVLDLLLEPLELTALVQDGQLLVTTTEYATSVLRTVLYDVSDIAARGNLTARLIEAIQSQTGDENQSPWADVHGVGGTIQSPSRGIIIVRQTEDSLAVIHALLADIRQAAATRPARPARDPNAYETRFYRLPAFTAQELSQSLQRRIARGTWNEPVEELIDPRKGTVEVLSVGTFWNNYSSFLGSGGSFGGGFGGGASGGGFFQFRDTGAEPAPTGGGLFLGNYPFSQFDAVLIVRHRVAVHEEILGYLNQLLFGDPEGSELFGPVPTGTLPEPWSRESE